LAKKIALTPVQTLMQILKYFIHGERGMNGRKQEDPIEGGYPKGDLLYAGKIKKEAKMWRIDGEYASPVG